MLLEAGWADRSRVSFLRVNTYLQSLENLWIASFLLVLAFLLYSLFSPFQYHESLMPNIRCRSNFFPFSQLVRKQNNEIIRRFCAAILVHGILVIRKTESSRARRRCNIKPPFGH